MGLRKRREKSENGDGGDRKDGKGGEREWGRMRQMWNDKLM